MKWKWDQRFAFLAAPYACMLSKMITHFWITSSSGTNGVVFPVGNVWSSRHPPSSRWKGTSMTVGNLRRHARQSALKVTRCLRDEAVRNLATSPRRGRKTKLTRKMGVLRERKSHVDHHSSPLVKLPLKNKVQVLHITVNAMLAPLLVTPRSWRNVKRSCTSSPCRRHIHRYWGIQCAMICWSTRHASWDTWAYDLPVNFLFFIVDVVSVFHH